MFELVDLNIVTKLRDNLHRYEGDTEAVENIKVVKSRGYFRVFLIEAHQVDSGPGSIMSVAGQGILTGPESADILSQALLQTGLSDAVKMEGDVGFDLPSDNLLSCDVQTLTDDLISQLDEDSTQGTVLPTPTLGSGALESPFDSGMANKAMEHPSGIPLCTVAPVSNINATSFVNGYSSAGPVQVKMEDGLSPSPQTVTSTVHQLGAYNTGGVAGSSAPSYGGGADIDLEDLLAIDVGDHLDTGMYSAPPSNQMSQDFPVPPQPSSFTPPEQYSSYQPPNSSQGLPELGDTDLYDILGGENDDFLDSLVEPPNNIPYIQNGSAPGLSGGHHQQQQAAFGGPMSYTPSPPNMRPYMSNSNMSSTTLPPAYTASNRPFQQPVAIPNRPYTLQQQMYMKRQGPRRTPITSPSLNRFPNAPRPFQIPGLSKVAAGTQESQVCVIW